MRSQNAFIYYADFILAPGFSFFIIAKSQLCFALGIVTAFGVCLWTLIEYALHRYTHVVRMPMHFRHHRLPLEYSGPTSLTTIPLYLIIYIALKYSVGPMIAHGITSGLLMGLSVYLYTHASIHRMTIGPKHILARAKARHDAHHQGKPGYYGVTTSLWDNVFKSSSRQ